MAHFFTFKSGMEQETGPIAEHNELARIYEVLEMYQGEALLQ